MQERSAGMVAATQVAAAQCAAEVVALYDIALAAVRAAPEDDLAGEVTGMRYADAACGCARARSAHAASSCPVLAIGLGAIAVARTTAARWPRSGSWRRSGRRQG